MDPSSIQAIRAALGLFRVSDSSGPRTKPVQILFDGRAYSLDTIVPRKERAGAMAESHTEGLLKRGRGRPGIYDPDYHPELAFELSLLGYTNDQIAAGMDVHVSTFKDWRDQHPEFAAAVTDGKSRANAKIVRAMFERACGYSHDAVKFFCTKDGVVIREEYTEYYPPDTAAAQFLLVNREGMYFRNRQELGTTPGQPFEIKDAPSIDVSKMTLEQLAKFKELCALAGVSLEPPKPPSEDDERAD